jgi:hypothetical protein
MKHSHATRSYIALAGAALLFATSPGIALSQSAPMESSGAVAQASQPSQKVDDATLQHVAKAYVGVRHITDDTKQRLARADSTQKDQISSQAEKQKLDIVKQEGINPDRYNEVLMMVQNDPDLQEKFLSYVSMTGGA